MRWVYILGQFMELTEEAYQRLEQARRLREEATGKPVTLDDVASTLVMTFLPPGPMEMS